MSIDGAKIIRVAGTVYYGESCEGSDERPLDRIEYDSQEVRDFSLFERFLLERYYSPETKQMEIPLNELPQIREQLKQYPIGDALRAKALAAYILPAIYDDTPVISLWRDSVQLISDYSQYPGSLYQFGDKSSAIVSFMRRLTVSKESSQPPSNGKRKFCVLL